MEHRITPELGSTYVLSYIEPESILREMSGDNYERAVEAMSSHSRFLAYRILKAAQKLNLHTEVPWSSGACTCGLLLEPRDIGEKNSHRRLIEDAVGHIDYGTQKVARSFLTAESKSFARGSDIGYTNHRWICQICNLEEVAARKSDDSGWLDWDHRHDDSGFLILGKPESDGDFTKKLAELEVDRKPARPYAGTLCAVTGTKVREHDDTMWVVYCYHCQESFGEPSRDAKDLELELRQHSVFHGVDPDSRKLD
jgi:hypothetical protein